jgi:hypothetical protein
MTFEKPRRQSLTLHRPKGLDRCLGQMSVTIEPDIAEGHAEFVGVSEKRENTRNMIIVDVADNEQLEMSLIVGDRLDARS